MRLANDDSLYRCDARWLGPRGWTLPWAARYSSYGIGFLLFLAAMTLDHRIFPFPLSAVVSVAVAVAVTTVVHRRIDTDRPVRSVITGFWSEVTAQRPPAAVLVEIRVPKRRR